MKKEDLLQFIRQPQAVSPELALEVKKLIRIYPYFQAGYLLLAKTTPTDANIKQAATHTLDRGLLRRLVNAAFDSSVLPDLQGIDFSDSASDVFAQLSSLPVEPTVATEPGPFNFAETDTLLGTSEPKGSATATLPQKEDPLAFIELPGDDEADNWLNNFERQYDQGNLVELELDLASEVTENKTQPPTLVADQENDDNFIFQTFNQQPEYEDVSALINDPDYLKLRDQDPETDVDLSALYRDDDLLQPVSDEEIFGKVSNLAHLPPQPKTTEDSNHSPSPVAQLPSGLADPAPDLDNFFNFLDEKPSDIGLKLDADQALKPEAETTPANPNEVAFFDNVGDATLFPPPSLDLAIPAVEAKDQPALESNEPNQLIVAVEAKDQPALESNEPNQLIVDVDLDGDLDWDDVYAMRKTEENRWFAENPEGLAAEPTETMPLIDVDQDGDIDWDDVHTIRKAEEANWHAENPNGLAELSAGLELIPAQLVMDLPEEADQETYTYVTRKDEEAMYWAGQAIDSSAERANFFQLIDDQSVSQVSGIGGELGEYQTRNLDEAEYYQTLAQSAPPIETATSSDNFFDSLISETPQIAVSQQPALDTTQTNNDYTSDDLSFFEHVAPKDTAINPPIQLKPAKDQWQIVDEFIKKEPRITIDKAKQLEEDDLPDLSEPSVQWNEEIASETLAKIYADQGKYAKVADIYRKLAENYPDKREAYFAKIASLPA